MDVDGPNPPLPLERSISQHSSISMRSSSRSTTVRRRSKRLASHVSSSASSIAASDKSLTSFPSFSPKSPKSPKLTRSLTSAPYLAQERLQAAVDGRSQSRGRKPTPEDSGDDTLTMADMAPAAAGRDGLGIGDKPASPWLSKQQNARTALFEDAPLASQKVPGALHTADDEHIERLIARHGATALARMLATDLAQRDAQIALMRRKADERERALRKIILECGLSNLELETRLRTIETETRSGRPGNPGAESGLSDLMSDAMQDTVSSGAYGRNGTDATIRASNATLASSNQKDEHGHRGTLKGWKNFLWGNSNKGGSVAPSVNGDERPPSVIRERRPGLQEDLFSPPTDDNSVRSPSRTSSVHSGPPGSRKPSQSMASSLMRLVAGGAINTREGEGARGRSRNDPQWHSQTVRASSSASAGTGQSGRSVSTHGGPKALMAIRRSTATPAPTSSARTGQQENRWDSMGGTPPSAAAASQQENYGPVEMDAILPPETQPPTLTHVYNTNGHGEYLTDRFGFIYDQRRKKRQREATPIVTRHIKKGSRTEMLTNGRSGISPSLVEEVPSPTSDGRPESLWSAEDRAEEEKPKRWTDYLKLATFPTELLSHTPTLGAPSLEVLEGLDLGKTDSSHDMPYKSPRQQPQAGLITSDERGFVPVASTTTSVADLEAAPPVEAEVPVLANRDDAEPVKLLLQHMSELHDSLQRERTVRWNDFLRKVRAERKRDGEAAAAAALAAAEARYERPSVMLPETNLADGELIGITGLGVKGKVGRAKKNELRNLVLGGIPVAFRAKAWSECSGATTLRVPGYYQDIVARPEAEDDPVVASQIRMDINRTLTDNIFFRKGPGAAKLCQVLHAYARRNPDVGYCQGMNLVAANLLLIMPSAEDAFWVLASIIENILPTGYYDHSLLASRADQQVLRQYVAEILPRLSAHLDELSIELEALTFQWFLSVFTDCLCAEALFRVWDVVFCMPSSSSSPPVNEPATAGGGGGGGSAATPGGSGGGAGGGGEGSTFLFQVALALLKLNESQLLTCNTPAAVYTYINHQMTNHAISIDNMIRASDALRRVVNKEDVESRRERAVEREKEVLKAREEENERRSKKRASGGDGNETWGSGEVDARIGEVSQAEEGNVRGGNGGSGDVDKGNDTERKDGD